MIPYRFGICFSLLRGLRNPLRFFSPYKQYLRRLTDKQKAAAAVLGFDEDEWDESDDEKARYEDVDWKHLLPDVKQAAIKLGYTQEAWDSKGGKNLSFEDKDWEDLTPDQKQLLSILGYGEEMVSSDEMDTMTGGSCSFFSINPMTKVAGYPHPCSHYLPSINAVGRLGLSMLNKENRREIGCGWKSGGVIIFEVVSFWLLGRYGVGLELYFEVPRAASKQVEPV